MGYEGAVLILAIIGFMYQARADAKQSIGLQKSIHVGMKDFHGRLCSLEERKKDGKCGLREKYRKRRCNCSTCKTKMVGSAKKEERKLNSTFPSKSSPSQTCASTGPKNTVGTKAKRSQSEQSGTQQSTLPPPCRPPSP